MRRAIRGLDARHPAPPAQDAVERALQPHRHATGELRPALELEFRNRNDERSLSLRGGENGVAEAAAGQLQRTKAVDDNGIDTLLDRCPGLRTHLVQPACVKAATTLTRLVMLAAHFDNLPTVEHHDPTGRAVAQTIAELNQPAQPFAGCR